MADYLVGKFIVHKECCARVNGNRQTFSLHKPEPSDPLFMPMFSRVPSGCTDGAAPVCFTIFWALNHNI